MTNPLRALIAKWRKDAPYAYEDSNPQYALALDQCADELEAALAAPHEVQPLQSQLDIERGRVEGLGVLLAELTAQRDDAERRAGSILQQCENQQDRIVELEAALAAPPPQPEKDFRRCGFCHVWATKPCGEQCCWSADSETVEQHKAALAAEPPSPDLLRTIQDALVEAFYDPDPADPDPELDYGRVDWVGVIHDARKQIDKLKAAEPPDPHVPRRQLPILKKLHAPAEVIEEAERLAAAPPPAGWQPQGLSFLELDRLSIRTGCETEANRQADLELKRRGYVFNASEQRWEKAAVTPSPAEEK